MLRAAQRAVFIIAGDDIEDDRCVLDRPADRPDGIASRRLRHHAIGSKRGPPSDEGHRVFAQTRAAEEPAVSSPMPITAKLAAMAMPVPQDELLA